MSIILGKLARFAHERHGLLIARAYADGVNLVRLGLVTRQSVELRLLAASPEIAETEALTAIRRGLAAAGVSRATWYRQQKAANGQGQGETVASGIVGLRGQGAHQGNRGLLTANGLIAPASALQHQHHDRAERQALFTHNTCIERTAA